MMLRADYLLVSSLLFGSFLPSVTASEVPPPKPGEVARFDSPRIAALDRELEAGNRVALDQFWEEIQGKAPLVEPFGGRSDFRWVTFLWRGSSETQNVMMVGGLYWPTIVKPLRRLRDSDLWYRTEPYSTTARFTYSFTTDYRLEEPTHPPRVRDPLNPRVFGPQSLFECLDAPPQRWSVQRLEIRAGTLKKEKLRSKILNEEREVGIYTPPGYRPAGKPCDLVVVFDGETYGSEEGALVPAPVVMDNLLAEGLIRPSIAVLVYSQRTRPRDLMCHAPFADFLARELVPWVRKRYWVSEDARRTVVAGSSLGGLCAAYCALRYPRIFGNVLSQSGLYWYSPEIKQLLERGTPPTDSQIQLLLASVEEGWLTRQFVQRPRLPLRFYLEVGRYEGTSVQDHRRLRDVLRARGYPVTYSEYEGGHDYLTWRNSLGDGLIALIGERR